MKKILLISISKHYVFHQFFFNLIKYFKYSKYDFYVITNRINSRFDYSPSNIHSIDFDSQKGIIKRLNLILKEINAIKPDLIWFVNVNYINLFISIILRFKYQIANSIHDLKPHKGDNKSIFIILYNFLIIIFSQFIVVHSKKAKSDLLKITKNHSKVFYIPFFIEFKSFQKINNTKTCLFFGRITKYKGISNLVKLIRNNNDINFIIAGKPDKYSAKILKRLVKYSNLKIFDQTLTESEKEYFFKNSELTILPYIDASQSGVIIDSYNFSRPIISFDVGYLKEQIVNNKTGFLIEKSNIIQFSEVLRNFISLPLSKKQKIANNSYSFGFETYSFQNSTPILIDFFDEIFKVIFK